MNHNEQIKHMAHKFGITRIKAREFLDEYADMIRKGLSENRQHRITGVGKIYLDHRTERRNYNPVTKAEDILPERDTVKFTPSSKIKHI